MRRHARRLHRDDLAVLVERHHRQYRAEKHRKGQEGLDDLRQPHPDIAPNVRIAVAGNRQNLAAFAEQVERLQDRSEEHTSELQSLMRISYAVFCLKKKKKQNKSPTKKHITIEKRLLNNNDKHRHRKTNSNHQHTR